MCTRSLSWWALLQLYPFKLKQRKKKLCQHSPQWEVLNSNDTKRKLFISRSRLVLSNRHIFNSKKVLVGHTCDECYFHPPIKSTEAERNLPCFWLKKINVLPAIYLAHGTIMPWPTKSRLLRSLHQPLHLFLMLLFPGLCFHLLHLNGIWFTSAHVELMVPHAKCQDSFVNP